MAGFGPGSRGLIFLMRPAAIVFASLPWPRSPPKRPSPTATSVAAHNPTVKADQALGNRW